MKSRIAKPTKPAQSPPYPSTLRAALAAWLAVAPDKDIGEEATLIRVGQEWLDEARGVLSATDTSDRRRIKAIIHSAFPLHEDGFHHIDCDDLAVVLAARLADKEPTP